MTVAGVVTYFVLAVERDFRFSTAHLSKSPAGDMLTGLRGIWVGSDPSIDVSESAPPEPIAPAAPSNGRPHHSSDRDLAGLLSAPPEPVATVVLHAPTAIPDMVALSMSDAKQSDELISAIDKAFEAPIRAVSLQRASTEPATTIDDSRLESLLPGAAIKGQVPTPVALLRQLSLLRTAASPMHAVSRVSVSPMGPVQDWIQEVETRLRRVVFEQGLLDPRTPGDLEELVALTARAHSLAANLDAHAYAVQIGATAYAVERRVRLWQAVSQCLQNGPRYVHSYSPDQVAREKVASITRRVAAELKKSNDEAAWRKFLRIDDLLAWSSDASSDWQRGNELATEVLTRMTWERLTPSQSKFLSGPNFAELTERLAPWAAQPIDYRQLLSDIEQLEDDPINRCRASLAHTVQVLRVSPQPEQRAVAEAINDHYRNANIRIAVSSELLHRMVPQESVHARPVRQRILGADTKGNSQVRTNLNVRLVPDPNAWQVELDLVGNMESATHSSKGPAVFHQTSIAKINSTRTIRMDLGGLKVTADPTSVDTRQFLNGMSTDLDRLPVVGDFFRALVREQFDQQRGVAQRIVRRMIAEETDQELDKQLHAQMGKAESQLQHTFIGPLERLKLNPIVVSMNTTEERLTARYRVAGPGQMAAHTARPRAPGDSLVSMQIHQSAINNALSQLGLSDRDWTLQELCDKLADVFDQSPWQLPEEAPRDVTVRFAPSRPVTAELVDGKVELTMRIAELNHPDRNVRFQRFIIKVSYVPVASGLQASLVRDGVVSVDGPRLGFAEKIPLRGIFGTVFSANTKVNLVHSQWQDDPRAEGLAVSQVEVRDGWLSIAVSDAASPHAARVAAAAREQVIQ